MSKFYSLSFILCLFCYTASADNSAGGPTGPATTTSTTTTTTTTAAPAIVSFTASATTISPGTAVTLKWTSTGGKAAAITGLGTEDTNGQVVVTPTETTYYTLTVNGSSGQKPSSLTILITVTATEDANDGPASDPFPRTMVNALGGNYSLLHWGNTNAGVPLATVLAQSNIVVIPHYFGVETTTPIGPYPTLMKGWKAAAAANGLTLRVIEYIGGGAPTYVSDGNTPWLTAAFNASSMWAYTSASGSGTTDIIDYSGSDDTGQSYLQVTPYNIQTVSPSFTFNGKTGVLAGYDVWNLYAQYTYDVLFEGLAISKYGEKAGLDANPELDGIFYDNASAKVQGSTTGTWDGLGTAPVGVTAQSTAAYQQGEAKVVAAFKARDPNIFLMANGGNFSAPYPAIDPTYQNLYGAVFNEGAIGYSWSIETWDTGPTGSPPGYFMQDLIQDEKIIAPGGTVVLHQVGSPGGVNNLTGNQSTWGATEWQAVRMGFAAAMQRNWHYALSCGQNQYSSIGLMDEQVQTVNDKPNYGWLSAGTQPMDPPQSAAWSNGVWRRRFPNGMVLWNPRGNGARTVTIPSTLCRIKTRGYGNKTVNNGECGATSVTLQDADGLFLIGSW